jgi:hypothetical protein
MIKEDHFYKNMIPYVVAGTIVVIDFSLREVMKVVAHFEKHHS